MAGFRIVMSGLVAAMLMAGAMAGAEEEKKLQAGAGGGPMVVTGRVYCDACGAGYFSKSSFYLSGAKVGLQCSASSSSSSYHVTAFAQAVTDSNGRFQIAVEGDHERETCVAMLLHSSHPSCNVLSRSNNGDLSSASATAIAQRGFAGVFLSRNAGLADNVVHTGPFSFQPGRISHAACAAELAAADAIANSN